jgi:hypothetical protein
VREVHSRLRATVVLSPSQGAKLAELLGSRTPQGSLHRQDTAARG